MKKWKINKEILQLLDKKNWCDKLYIATSKRRNKLEEKSYTMKEMTEKKFDLPFGEIFSFSQIYDLKKVRRHVNSLWKDHRELFDHLERARMFSLLLGKEELWEKFWKKHRYSIGFKVLNEFFDTLKYRMCKFCDNPYSEGRADKVYCSDLCRHNDYLRRKNKKMKTPA